MNAKKKKEVLKRIRFVAGQLEAVEQMIAEGKDSTDVYVQLRSIESAFTKSIFQSFESEHRYELAEKIVEELENCPGSCEYCKVVDTMKKDFPSLSLTQVLDGLHRINKGKK